MNISLSPKILFHIGSFPVTNAFFWFICLAIVLILISLIIRSILKDVPGRFQSFVEVLFTGAFSFIESIIGSKSKARKVFPLVFTMFILILTANLATYIPGQAAISLNSGSGETIPVFRAVMSDYSIVFIMTMITVLLVQFVSIFVHGPFGYIKKFIVLKGIGDFFKGLLKGKFKIGVLAQGFLDFFLGIMDIVGEVAKIVSLSFRLFGNIFAGEVLIAVMLFLGTNIFSILGIEFANKVLGNVLPTLAATLAPLPFMLLGLLTAVVQAFVFSVLTLIFITMASEIEEDELAEQHTV